MKDILVVYFSLGGHTRRVAQHIAQLADADCEPIHELRPRRGWLGYLRAAYEAMWSKAAEIEAASLQPRHYELVVIGAPVWAQSVCSPARTYLTRHRGDFAQVALFCTHGGPTGTRVLDEMAKLCGRKPVAMASFQDVEVDSGQFMPRADAFAGQLRAHLKAGGTTGQAVSPACR